MHHKRQPSINGQVASFWSHGAKYGPCEGENHFNSAKAIVPYNDYRAAHHFCPDNRLGGMMLVILIASIIPVVYSYKVYRHQKML